MTLTKQDGAERLLKVLHSSFNFKTHYEDSKHKSEICRAAFQASSQCKFKSDCDFAHDIRELRPRVFDLANFKRQKCCNWATGCQYATRCLYLHDEKSHEIETGMILLHSHKERKFRIVRDQGDGTVCVFTLHSDGKPKDALGKSVINSLWSFAKGKYGAIKLMPGAKKLAMKPQKVIKQGPKMMDIKKTSAMPKVLSTKLVPNTCPIASKPLVQAAPPKVTKASPVVGYIGSHSPPLDSSAVILPEPLHTFNSQRYPPGFAIPNLPTSNAQPLYLEPITLPPSSHAPAPVVHPQATVSMQPMQAINPGSTLDHKAPPYIPGKTWAPSAAQAAATMPATHLPTYNHNHPDNRITPMTATPIINTNIGYRPYEYLAPSPSPPLTFTYSASPPFGPYASPQYSFVPNTRFMVMPQQPQPQQSIRPALGEINHNIPPELPPSGVLMPPAIPHSPAVTPQKQNYIIVEEDQVDQKEESPLRDTSPRSREGSVDRGTRESIRSIASQKGSERRDGERRTSLCSPLKGERTLSLTSRSPENEEHKTPDRPIKQGVFDPLLMEVDETKGLLKMIADYHKCIGSQVEQIRKLEEENARLRVRLPA